MYGSPDNVYGLSAHRLFTVDVKKRAENRIIFVESRLSGGSISKMSLQTD